MGESKLSSLGAGVFAGLWLLTFTAGCASQRPASYRIAADYGVADPQFSRVMTSLLGSPLIAGNRCQTLLNGDQIFPSMLEAIERAQKTVDCETYIYWSGKVGEQFTKAFCERAAAGVKVHLMIDWLGSDKIDKGSVRRMRECGVQVEEFHPFHLLDPTSWRQLNTRTHRKLLIIDGQIAFTGGVGIADEWSGNADTTEHWRDNHYRVQGPVVADLQAAFMDNWIKTTGRVLVTEEYFPPLQAEGPLWAQVFKSSSQGGSETMQLMMLLSISAARKNIRMESAYFVPDAVTRKYLLAARRRGVAIEVIVPGPHIDEKVVRQASRADWGELLRAGVIIHEYQPTMFHCKQLIVDDRWVSIGSANMDNRSFRINDEANLNILSEQFAAGQIRVFEMDKKRARPVSYEAWLHRPLGEKISERMATLLDWLL